MALPIWAQFIKRVLADPSLPYKSTDTFYYPSNYNPCSTEGLHEQFDETPEADSSFFD
jgi:hypothetical protein